MIAAGTPIIVLLLSLIAVRVALKRYASLDTRDYAVLPAVSLAA